MTVIRWTPGVRQWCMWPTCCVYVDIGYLLASAATRMTDTSLRRGVHVAYSKLVASLVDAAESRSGVSVLRVYWCNSAKNGIPGARSDGDDARQ